MSRWFPGNKGFSLLEVVITVAILATGIVVVVQAFSVLNRSAVSGENLIRAAFLAEDLMRGAELKYRCSLSAVPSIESGETDSLGWEISLAETGEALLCRSDVSVAWEEGGRSRRFSVGAYLRR